MFAVIPAFAGVTTTKAKMAKLSPLAVVKPKPTTTYSGVESYYFLSVNSNHIAFNTANEQASPVPNIHEKYHILFPPQFNKLCDCLF